MGQVREQWVRHRFIELTAEDCRKQEERRRRRQNGEIRPRVFEWQRRFTKRLAKCPVCGKTPNMNCIWDAESGYTYKFCCNFCHYKSPDGYTRDMGCGDWYGSLSRAGLSWNYRVKEALFGGEHDTVRHTPLTQTKRRKEDNKDGAAFTD